MKKYTYSTVPPKKLALLKKLEGYYFSLPPFTGETTKDESLERCKVYNQIQDLRRELFDLH